MEVEGSSLGKKSFGAAVCHDSASWEYRNTVKVLASLDSTRDERSSSGDVMNHEA